MDASNSPRRDVWRTGGRRGKPPRGSDAPAFCAGVRCATAVRCDGLPCDATLWRRAAERREAGGHRNHHQVARFSRAGVGPLVSRR